MNKVQNIDAINYTMTVDAGCVLANIQSTARQAERLFPLSLAAEGASIAMDISVPVSQVPNFVVRAREFCLQAVEGSQVLAFGHIGDGNIHFLLAQPPDMNADEFLTKEQMITAGVYDIAYDLEGSFSAEHGIGTFKKKSLEHYKSSLELSLMRNLKHMFDPNNIMNPGKIL